MPMPDDDWQLLQGEVAGKPAIVRFNRALQSLAGTDGYKDELIVSVKLAQPTDAGLTTAVEAGTLNTFEDALRHALGPAPSALLAVVMTTDGFRDFIFYTGEPMVAVRRIQSSVAPTFSDLNVDVRGRPDPEWTQYRRFFSAAP